MVRCGAFFYGAKIAGINFNAKRAATLNNAAKRDAIPRVFDACIGKNAISDRPLFIWSQGKFAASEGEAEAAPAL